MLINVCSHLYWPSSLRYVQHLSWAGKSYCNWVRSSSSLLTSNNPFASSKAISCVLTFSSSLSSTVTGIVVSVDDDYDEQSWNVVKVFMKLDPLSVTVAVIFRVSPCELWICSMLVARTSYVWCPIILVQAIAAFVIGNYMGQSNGLSFLVMGSPYIYSSGHAVEQLPPISF